MKTIFFTADQHFGHRNILRLCSRPFSSVEEMDEKMIARWNAKVTERNTVYILGDLLLRNEKPPEDYLKRLRGRKHLLVGNHDKAWLKRCDVSRWFESVNEMLFTSDGQHRLELCHYPVLGTGHFMIHGHIHNNTNAAYWLLLKSDASMLNAGVDINDFAPVSFEELVTNNAQYKKQ